MVTMNILAKKLRNSCACRMNKKAFDDHILSAPMLYDGSCLSSEYVYVARGSELRRESVYGMNMICAGEPDFKPEDASCDMIVTDITDLHTLFNMVQSIFFAVLRWDALLDGAVDDQMDIQVLLDLGRQELPFSFFYLDRSYNLLANSSGQINGAEAKLLVDRLLEDGAVGTDQTTDIPRYFRNDDTGFHGYFFNFYYGEDYRGKLLAVVPEGTVPESADLSLLKNLCRHISRIYRFFSISSVGSREYNMLRILLYALLESEMNGGGGNYFPRSHEQIAALAAQTYWKLYDNYILCYIPFENKLSLSSKGEYLVTLLENKWRTTLCDTNSKGIILGHGIALVAPLPSSDERSFLPFLPVLQEVLVRFQARAGISCICNDLFNLPVFLQQAAIAVRTGTQSQPVKRVYRFSECALDYIIENCTASFRWEDLAHPCIRILLRYDNENGTELCKTLRVFMRCRYNVLQASNMLYIHRSTFSVRIKRIEILCGIDLEEESVRLHILISFYLMEAKGLLPFSVV